MMHERRSASPQLETLESLTLLSGAAVLAPVLPTPAEITTTLGGTLRGVFLEHQQGTEVIYDYDVKAAGKLTPIGAATITGILEEFPGLADNDPTGSLDLITSKGTLALQMPQPTMSPEGVLIPTSPHELVAPYNISGGTGVYQDDTGTGVVDFTFTASHSVKGFQAGGVDIKFTTLSKTTTT